MPDHVSVVVRGDFALFTRPELKVERISYQLMTPSAARGVLEAILFKPQFRWAMKSITALRPRFPAGFPEQAAGQNYRLIAIRRNEITGKVPTGSVNRWMNDAAPFSPYLVDSAGREGPGGANRAQRNSMVLQHVAYRIDATPILTVKANQDRKRPEDEEDRGPDSVAKYVAMFNRRVAKGQCFHRPYLGCREFACDFMPPDPGDEPLADWTESLGLMLYDIKYGSDGNRPGFFDAVMDRGVLHCDLARPSRDGRDPVRVFGWDTEEAVR